MPVRTARAAFFVFVFVICFGHIMPDMTRNVVVQVECFLSSFEIILIFDVIPLLKSCDIVAEIISDLFSLPFTIVSCFLLNSLSVKYTL